LRVLIDESISEATLVEVGMTFVFRQIDTAGATPDGTRLYLVSKYEPGGTGDGNGRMGYMDLVTGEFKNPNGTLAVQLPDPNAVFATLADGTTLVQGLVLGAFSPSGVFYVGSQVTNQLYTLNVDTGIATPLGTIHVDNTVVLRMSGADFAFTADNRMFLWTNAGVTGAPKGLYEVHLGPPIEAVYLDDPTNTFLTGLAFRSNGFFQGTPPMGELTGSTRSDEIAQFDLLGDPATINYTHLYPMMCGCGDPDTPYEYTYGDMANPLGHFACVYTIGYWKNHAWEYVEDVPASIALCGNSISEAAGQDLLKGANSKDFSMLTAQLIAAKLNTGGGNGLAIVSDAEAFLCSETEGVWDMAFSDEAQKAEANYYKDALDDFNNGSAISTHCE